MFGYHGVRTECYVSVRGMPMLTRVILVICMYIGVGFPLTLKAESADCTTPVIIIADGRITSSSFPAVTLYWYGIYTQAGHSYSVEFEAPADNYVNTPRVQLSTISAFDPSDSLVACHGTSSVALTQNSGFAPVIFKGGNGSGRRVSFTAQSAGLYRLSVANVSGAGSYSFRAVDTTIFSPRWSTYSGYDTQWGFMNVSDMQIDGLLQVFDSNSKVMANVPLTVPAAGYILRTANSPGINLPKNASGYVIFSHNGPPGAISADAYVINGSATVIVPMKFEPGGSH